MTKEGKKRLIIILGTWLAVIVVLFVVAAVIGNKSDAPEVPQPLAETEQ